jgi:probable rRNA maturation factor
MTASPESASADQDDGGSPSSAESDIPAEPPERRASPPTAGRPANGNAVRASQPAGEADINVAIMPGVQRIFDLPWLSTRLAAALTHIPRPVQRVSVLIVDDERMTSLNRHHLGAARTTDVLTFPINSADEAIDADIAICADAALRQAEKRGHRPDRELLLYALHGVLHCAGFDDRSPPDAAAMHEEEDRILRAIGVGSTFADDSTARAARHVPAARARGNET